MKRLLTLLVVWCLALLGGAFATHSPFGDILPQAGPPVYTLPPTGLVKWDWNLGASDSQVRCDTGVKVLDVDGFQVSAATVAKCHTYGVYMICYLDVGSWEPGRADSGDYPAYLKVQQDPDWKQEWFLDVTDVFKPDSALARILGARFRMCKDKGFDGVEPDNLQNDENIKGSRRPTLQQQIDFNGWVADAIHTAGLAAFQKNGPDKILLKDRTGATMLQKFDAILNEQCQQYKECQELVSYPKAGKLALDTEYQKGKPLNCAVLNGLGVSAISRDLDLTAVGSKSYRYAGCVK